jgi:hypothetical protein
MLRASYDLFFEPVTCTTCNGTGDKTSVSVHASASSSSSASATSSTSPGNVTSPTPPSNANASDAIMSHSAAGDGLSAGQCAEAARDCLGNRVGENRPVARKGQECRKGFQVPPTIIRPQTVVKPCVESAHPSSVPVQQGADSGGCGECNVCEGTGVMEGDLKYKQELAGGVPYKLRIIAKDSSFGMGVIADEKIPANVAVCEYVGELLSERYCSSLFVKFSFVCTCNI